MVYSAMKKHVFTNSKEVMKMLLLLFYGSLYLHTSQGYDYSLNVSDNAEFIQKPQLYETQDSWDDHSPILLWWTKKQFSGRNLKSVSKITCKTGQCLTTLNRDFLMNKRTRGLLFQGTHITPEDLPLPRQPWHEWALFHEESPLNNYMLCHQSFLRLFNHTATSKRESDFPLTLHWIPNDNYLTSRQPFPVKQKNNLKKNQGLAPVLYIQSHCEVPSDRDRYVKELMKYIHVDSFGKCLQNKKWKKEFHNPVDNLANPKFFDFIAQYKFHLAFENAFLEDYFTEKLTRAYHVGSIPIYKGAPNAKDWMPSNKSTIFVDDFESPEQLANFIKHLDENDEEYNAYLKYKTEGIRNAFLLQNLHKREWRVNEMDYPNMLQSFECYVCDEIYKRRKLEEENQSMPFKFANRSHYGCQQPYTLLAHPNELPFNDTWRKIDWIEMYWNAFDQGLAVTAMLEAKERDSSEFKRYLKNIYAKRLRT